MTDSALFDFRAVLAPLLAASPGSQAVATCGRCGRSIDGLAALDHRGFVQHPEACPVAPIERGKSPGRAQGELFDGQA